MKTYPYIVINKNNMKTLHHFKTAEQVVNYIWDGWICDFIVIANEKYVVDLSHIGSDEDILIRISKLRKALK